MLYSRPNVGTVLVAPLTSKKNKSDIVIDIGEIEEFEGFSYCKIDQLRAVSKLRIQTKKFENKYYNNFNRNTNSLEVTHTFDLRNGDTEARKIFGKIAPQCIERMLDEYLLNLNDKDIQKYGLNRSTLIQDIRNRQVSTFLSRKDNIKSFNNGTGNQEVDLRYILAQIYSSAFMKLDVLIIRLCYKKSCKKY